MGTTANGYPYPEDSDPIAQGAQAVKALATATETNNGASAAGQVTAVLTNVTAANVLVTFPAGRFKVSPMVTALPVGTSGYFAYAASTPNATSANVGVRVYTGVNSTANVNIQWIARTSG